MAQPLKYKLTEEDLKKMTNSILFHLKETFDVLEDIYNKKEF